MEKVLIIVYLRVFFTATGLTETIFEKPFKVELSTLEQRWFRMQLTFESSARIKLSP